MNLKIKLSLFPIMAILLFHAAVLKIAYIDNYNMIALTLGIIIAIYLMTEIKVIFKRKYLNINLSLLIFSLIFLFTAFYNETNFDGTILYIMRVVLLFLFIEYAHEKGKIKTVTKIFCILSFIYLAFTYILILKDPLMAWKNDLNYLIGTKFSVSYMGLTMLALYFFTYQKSLNKFKNKVIGILLILFSFAIALKVKCSTGVMGNVLFLLLYFASFKNIKKVMSNPKNILILFVVCSSILIFFYNVFINISFVKFIVEDVFNKSLTLTGRMFVYNNIWDYIKERFFIGYGYNSVYNLFNNVMYIGTNAYALTAQNALLEYWLYSGAFGVINLFMIMYNSLKCNYINNSSKNNNEYYPFIVGLLILIILGMVEVTVNLYFFLFLAILNMGNISGKASDDNEVIVNESSNFVHAKSR